MNIEEKQRAADALQSGMVDRLSKTNRPSATSNVNRADAPHGCADPHAGVNMASPSGLELSVWNVALVLCLDQVEYRMRMQTLAYALTIVSPLLAIGGTVAASHAFSARVSTRNIPAVASSVLPGQLSQSTRKELAQFLEQNSTFGRVDIFPPIEFLSAQQLNALHFGARALEPNMVALSLYDRTSAIIYLPRGWQGRTPAELSMLVHEMVHFLQDQAGRKFACPQEREDEAFAVQERWLIAHGSTLEREFGIDPFTRLTASLCYY